MKSCFVIAALLFTLPAAAQVEPSSSPPEKSVEKPQQSGDDRKICRLDLRTSTRMAKRTCRTVAEWRVLDRKTDGANTTVRNP